MVYTTESILNHRDKAAIKAVVSNFVLDNILDNIHPQYAATVT